MSSSPSSKKKRKNERKRQLRTLRLLFSARHFLHTSRDGAVIAQIVGVQPIDLYRWSKTEKWTNALRYWDRGYNGTTELQGDYFKSVVGDGIVERSLKHASRS